MSLSYVSLIYKSSLSIPYKTICVFPESPMPFNFAHSLILNTET